MGRRFQLNRDPCAFATVITAPFRGRLIVPRTVIRTRDTLILLTGHANYFSPPLEIESQGRYGYSDKRELVDVRNRGAHAHDRSYYPPSSQGNRPEVFICVADRSRKG